MVSTATVWEDKDAIAPKPLSGPRPRMLSTGEPRLCAEAKPGHLAPSLTMEVQHVCKRQQV